MSIFSCCWFSVPLNKYVTILFLIFHVLFITRIKGVAIDKCLLKLPHGEELRKKKTNIALLNSCRGTTYISKLRITSSDIRDQSVILALSVVYSMRGSVEQGGCPSV